MHDFSGRNTAGRRVSKKVIRDLDLALRPSKYIDYHPLEVNYWKQATYHLTKRNYKEAEILYEKALTVCYTYSDYVQLEVIGLGIRSEYIFCLLEQGNRKLAQKQYQELNNSVETILNNTKVPGIISFVSKFKSELALAEKGNELNKDIIWKVSRLITF